MKRWALCMTIAVAGCSQSPSPEKREAEAVTETESANDDVMSEKKSIEEAADAAAKLVEAEAREEISALESTTTE